MFYFRENKKMIFLKVESEGKSWLLKWKRRKHKWE
jgi:hypothetical protein